MRTRISATKRFLVRNKPLSVAVMVVALVAVALLMLRATSSSYTEAATIGQGNPSFKELSDRFTALANDKGAVYSFDVLKRAPLPSGIDLHLLGHVVGDILYKQKGIDGIAYCTQDFRNACSHAIVIGELNEFGAGAQTVANIQAACKKAPGGPGAYTMCFHGLGHGVFAYFADDLAKTAAFCKNFGTPQYGMEEYTQCVGGSVMELVDGGGHNYDQWVAANKRYFKTSDPLAPCDESVIPDAAKSFCYTYLTPHLFQAAGAQLANPDPTTFPKAFHYCDAVNDHVMRDTCYSSFGKEFIPLAAARDIRAVDQMSDAEYQQAIQWCTTGVSAHIANACIGQALASVFWGGENDPAASFRFCSLVSDAGVQETCYQQLAENIASYTNGTRRSELCAKLPNTYHNSCESAPPHLP